MRSAARIALVACVAVLVSSAVWAPAAEGASSSTLTFTPSHTVVRTGASLTLQGLLSVEGLSTLPPLTVVLSAQEAGGDVVELAQAVVTAEGSASFTHAPTYTTAYRMSFAGNAELSPADAWVTVQVRSAVTLALPELMLVDREYVFTGSVRPARSPGSLVRVQRLLDGAWVDWGTAALDEASAFAFPVTFRQRANPRFRAVVAADARNAAGSSEVVRTGVVDPNPHDVPSSYRRCIVIDHSEYRLYYYEWGKVVRRFPCVLGKPSTPTPMGTTFRIQRKRYNPGGANGARYMGYYGIIGIHGTNQPQLLSHFPRAYSMGCTRLYDRDIIWLYARCPIGTRVWNVR